MYLQMILYAGMKSEAVGTLSLQISFTKKSKLDDAMNLLSKYVAIVMT